MIHRALRNLLKHRLRRDHSGKSKVTFPALESGFPPSFVLSCIPVCREQLEGSVNAYYSISVDVLYTSIENTDSNMGTDR